MRGLALGGSERYKPPPMRPRLYNIISKAVSEGVAAGWAAVHKHREDVPPHEIQAAIEDAVLDSLSEVFEFDDEEEEIE